MKVRLIKPGTSSYAEKEKAPLYDLRARVLASYGFQVDPWLMNNRNAGLADKM
ncbi:MAG TPA: hypothetical protein VGV87_09010 [Blastocatellia bacterium]|jgi:hypothetical protein|nr:hypothetical protein [Blastocatellia bacterium]